MELTSFETAIRNFLENMAKEDANFAKTYAKENKSIEECCKYICQEVQKQRKGKTCVGVADDEVYGMAIHYYDEDDIIVENKPMAVKVTTSPEPQPQNEINQSESSTPTKKTRKPRAKKTSTTIESDENIPVALEIPIF